MTHSQRQRRVHSKRFVNHKFHVLETGNVFVGDVIFQTDVFQHFLVDLLLDVRMDGKQVGGVGQSAGSGLIAGQQENVGVPNDLVIVQ